MGQEHQAGSSARVGLTTGEGLQYVKDNYRIEGNKSGVVYAAVDGASTTAVTMPAITKLPPGFRFTIDNSGGSGTFTITHDGGATTTASTTVVKECYVTAHATLQSASLS